MEIGEMAVRKITDWMLFFYVEGSPWNVGSTVLCRGKKAIVFDTADSVPNGKRVKDYLQGRGIEHFTVVNTHWHFDHIGGNVLYEHDDILSTALTRTRVLQNKTLLEAGGGGSEVGRDPGDLDTISFLEVAFPVVVPNITFDDRMRMYLDDLELELFRIHIHTRDCMVCYVPREKVLIAGDTLEAPLSPIIEAGSIATQLENLKLLLNMDIKTVVPQHGNVERYGASGAYDKGLIRNSIRYLEQIILRVDDPSYLEGTMEEYITPAVEQRESYRTTHRTNLELVQRYMSR